MTGDRLGTPVLPGATIGLLGGGQLARMTALAARSMGYRIAVLDPDATCAAAPVVDEVIVGGFDDEQASLKLAERCAVVSYEIERVAPAVLQCVAGAAPLRPGAAVLQIVQDRGQQKRFLEQHGYPVGAWRCVGSGAELETAIAEMGPCRVKRSRGGYDGRSQLRVAGVEQAREAFQQLGGDCVAEAELELATELSVLVARSPRGEVAVHPVAQNRHREGVLLHSMIPAGVEAGLARRARQMAVSLAEDLGVEGLLVVEMFVTQQGELLVNELAPRPHNTFHAAGECCLTSQFEQFVRAICGLPLGSTEANGSAVLINLLGGVGNSAVENAAPVLRIPGVSLHLYGKAARPKRKIGHVVARGSSASQAWERASHAMRVLGMAEGETEAEAFGGSPGELAPGASFLEEPVVAP